jgi:hypothetical protein
MRRGAMTLMAMGGLAAAAAMPAQAAQTQIYQSSLSFLNPTSGHTDSALATFFLYTGTDCTVAGTNCLVVDLKNTSTFSAQYNNTDILTSVFFNDGGDGSTLTPISALAFTRKYAADSTFTDCGSAGCNAGGDYAWTYSATGFTKTPVSTTSQNIITAVGYSGMTPTVATGKNFAGGIDGIDGLSGGIVASPFSGLSGNGGFPVYSNRVDFKFQINNYDPGTFKISKVAFGYGSVPEFLKAPEPATLAIVASGVAGLVAARRRRSRKPL